MRRDAFDRHEFSHTGIKKYTCDHTDCNKSYTNQTHLRRHIRSAHTNKEEASKISRVICQHENCAKQFANTQVMQRHFKLSHLSADKQYKCENCPESFHRKTQLKVLINLCFSLFKKNNKKKL